MSGKFEAILTFALRGLVLLTRRARLGGEGGFDNGVAEVAFLKHLAREEIFVSLAEAFFECGEPSTGMHFEK